MYYILLLSLTMTPKSRRAVLEQKDMHGDTPLLSAARAHSAACFRTLVAAGADYASPVTNLGSTALHVRLLSFELFISTGPRRDSTI